MISVTHIAEPKKKICFSRNISIVDLEEIWPSNTISERLSNFFSFLREKEDERKVRNNWFNIGDVRGKENESIENTTKRLFEIRQNYPGWVYLPYDLRKRTNLFLDFIGYNEKELRKAELQTALDFIYEYVLIYSLAGCPLYEEDVKLFWDLISEWIPVNDKEKLNTICVHLARAFREQGKWDEFDKCTDILHDQKLAYDEEQLLKSEECRRYQQQFIGDAFIKELHSWSMSDNDVYWPIIKSGMLAQCGEFQDAKSILMNNLSKVRRQLSKKKDDLYLSSVEECTVHLLKYIKQADGLIGIYEKESDNPINESGLSWWNDNEKYGLRVLSCKPLPEYQEYSLGYRLESVVTTHYSGRNPAIQLSMEYWRFREVSGSPFRIGIMVRKDALEESIQWLKSYYAQWAAYLLISSGQSKYIDHLYGRVQISEKSIQDVDNEIASYIQILKRILNEDVSNKNITIFTNAVNTIPEIIGRLSYKCSVDKKDELLDTLYELSTGKYRHSCGKLNVLIESIMMSYTQLQQIERLEKLLKFPYRRDVVTKYIDPLRYVRRSVKKIELNKNAYDSAIFEVKNGLEDHNREVRESALDRLLLLDGIVRLRREDRRLLIDALNNLNNTRSALILYQINKTNRSEHLNRIVNDTYDELVKDVKNTNILSIGAPHYADLISVLSEVDFNRYNPAEWCQAIIAMINAVSNSYYKDENEIIERIKNATKIAIGLLISLARSETRNEKKSKINDLMQCLDQYYDNPIWTDLLKCVLNSRKTYDEFDVKHKVLNGSRTNMNLYSFTIEMLNTPRNKKLLSVEGKKLMNAAMNHIIDVLLVKDNDSYVLIDALDDSIKLIRPQEGTRKSLDYLLKRAAELTAIGNDDSEQNARGKVFTRRMYAVLASTCNKRNVKLDSIAEWKRICDDPDEFLEVRRVSWD